MASHADIVAPPPRLLLVAGGRRIELDHDAVIEVLQTGRVVPVRGAPPWLAGLVAWKGRVLTLVDAGVLYGCRPARGPWMAVLKDLVVDAALLFDGDPRLAGSKSSPDGASDGAAGPAVDLALDRGALATHEAFQPGAARPRDPSTPEEA